MKSLHVRNFGMTLQSTLYTKIGHLRWFLQQHNLLIWQLLSFLASLFNYYCKSQCRVHLFSSFRWRISTINA